MGAAAASLSAGRMSLDEGLGLRLLQAVSDGRCVVLGFELLSSALAAFSLGICHGQLFLTHAWLQCQAIVSCT